MIDVTGLPVEDGERLCKELGIPNPELITYPIYYGHLTDEEFQQLPIQYRNGINQKREKEKLKNKGTGRHDIDKLLSLLQEFM